MYLFRTLVFAAVICPVMIVAQSSAQLAKRVESVTAGSMKLVSSSKDHTHLISANGKGYTLLRPEAAQQKNAVSSAVNFWLGQYAKELFQLSDKAELREYETERIGNLWQTSFTLYYNGIPIRERYLKVNTGALSGAIMMIRSTLPSATPTNSTPLVTPDQIYSASLKEITGSPKQVSSVREVYLDKGTTLQLAYEVIAGSRDRERWRLTYDALTGKLLEKKNLLLDRCFEHNGIGEEAHHESTIESKKQHAAMAPLATASGRLTALVHLNVPTDQLTEVGLPEMDIIVNGTTTRTDSLGYWSLPSVTYPLIINASLQNPYLTVQHMDAQLAQLTVSAVIDTIGSGQGNLKWDNSNSTQSERDALYSLLRTRAHIKSIEPGLQNIDQPLRAEVDYNAACNAFYDPEERSFTFFGSNSTCNPTAQVADVVYHEFGHRVNHCRYLGTDLHNMQDPSLNEGFADIYSILMRDDPRIGVGFYTNPSQVLRNCQNTRKWPTNLSPDPHINGLIVAGAFWDLRKVTGLNTAIQLFHSMSRLTPDGSGAMDAESLRDAFTNVLVATILADDDDNDLSNGTPHVNEILASFEKHNITLVDRLQLQLTPIPDQSAEATGYPVNLQVSYTGPVGALDESSVTFHYSTDAKTYTALLLERSTDSTFEATLPEVASGSIVYYYASARTTLDDVNTAASKEQPMKFLVGFNRRFFDDFETNKNWLKKDSVASGRWERGEPYGTMFTGAEYFYVQQDTDHTALGVSCYVTGNSNTSSPSFDDVDNGVTTLTSPQLDIAHLNDPYIRYWYFYSNDMGQNPGISRFVVEISNDSEEWVEAVSTTAATDGWHQALIRVKDILPITANMKVRFVASDTIGSLVEAGVDDFEVLDAVKEGNVSVRDGAADNRIILEVYPQPVTSNDVRLRVLSTTGSAVTLSLKDLLGVERLTSTIASTQPDHELALQLPLSLPNGVYILECKSLDQATSTKLILSR